MNLLTAVFKHPDLVKKLIKSRKRILVFMAAQLQYNRAMLFRNEGAYNGHDRWKPPIFRKGRALQHRGTLKNSLAPKSLKTATAPAMPQNGYIRFGTRSVILGTKLKKAAILNYGGKITAKPGGALMIPVPGNMVLKGSKKVKKMARRIGTSLITDYKKIKTETASGGMKSQNFIFRKSVTIPPRDFISINHFDEMEIGTAVQNLIVKILKGK